MENGFTPYEAIAAGTTVASKVVARMNGQDNFGVILPGKRADLMLLKQNPLKDISNTRKISGVMAAGRWYDEETLDVRCPKRLKQHKSPLDHPFRSICGETRKLRIKL